MDVFASAAGDSGAFLRAAAIAAGHDLGLFAGGSAAGGRRLRALVDVLVALGALVRDGDRLVRGTVPPRPDIARDGWGLIADVIRRDRPLTLPGGELERRMHAHLARAGAAAARELAPRLGTTSLADLGGGAGAYSAAFLEAGERATLVDARAVLALAREELARFGDRVRFVEGDARTAAIGEHGAALLSNVLHFHAPAACAELCAAAARAVGPGGVVAIKDLRVDDGRAGPIEGLLFALDMAIYTEDGDVHETARLRGWLAGAGLVAIEELRLATAPDAIVVIGRKP